MPHTIKDTVERDICIGCGACAYASGGQIPIILNDDGMYAADLTDVPDDVLRAVDSVCPFSDAATDEDAFAAKLFGTNLTDHEFLGKYLGTYAGRVSSTPYLEGSSSGGMTSWLLRELVERDIVDAVINVGGAPADSGQIFSYEVTDPAALDASRKSKYYSTTMDDALHIVRTTDRRYALVGVPCFIKAARLVAERDAVIRDRVKFHVGLVCGHMKSQFFGESLAWQLGIPPADLETVDFRIKNPDRASSNYDFGAKSKSEDEWRKRRTGDLVGGNWGYATFQPEVCNFCDDIFAETADVCFGDAWLPQYSPDWRGTNVVISRSPLVDQILEEGASSGALELDALNPEEVAKSQAGNFRHRRVGVSVRLADDKAKGLSIPRKRVKPGYEGVDAKRLKIIRLRRELSRLSFSAYKDAKHQNDLDVYLTAMEQGIREYRQIDATPLWRRAASKLKRTIRQLLR